MIARVRYITCEVSGCTFHSLAKFNLNKNVKNKGQSYHCMKAYNPGDQYQQKLKFPPSNEVKVHLNVKVVKQDLLL